MDAATFGADVVAAVRSFLEQEVDPLLARIDALEKQIADRPKPKDGKDGKDADPEVIKQMVSEAVAALPPAENGKDADPEHVASLVKEEAERILAGWERPKNGIDGRDGLPGEKGADGVPGRDGIDGLPGKDGIDGRDGKDGSPGINGKDGIDAMDVMVDREGALVFTLSDGRMKNVGLVVGKDGDPGRDGANGADGVPGKDGLDGVGFDDIDLTIEEEGVMIKFTRGENVKQFRLPVLIDRGVFKEGTQYRKGDGVTWGGSFWIAQDDTVEKPDSGKGWRLAVKKGRDGKDGTTKPPKKPGPVKVG